MNDLFSITMIRRGHHRRAFLAMDMLMGMIVLGILAGVFTLAAHRANLASARLARSRRAMDVAESALTALQSGQTIESESDARVTIKRLQPTDANSAAQWVRVEVNIASAGHAELFGVVPPNVRISATDSGETR